MTNGSTRDGKEALGEDYPYLTITDCSEDVEAVEQIQTVTLDKLDAEITQCDTTGYVQSVRVGKKSVSGEEFRNTYGLASSCFTLQNYNGKLKSHDKRRGAWNRHESVYGKSNGKGRKKM